ncbi:hypothetical protein DICVIV_13314 [Dictyocaulus viviparus]|uniref:Thrombospondin type 1 domain protein n=1 Tax=Dictyocaulus viviparus TaxID=29172 RepID=A0A0D8XAR7_DICVI|nr:hypothetical protein DICVIV_13314 [Dictyocaulus viviparus]
MTVSIILFSALTTSILSSECEVSKWSTWSSCYGTCYYALSVRNRDVIRPPFPDDAEDRVKRCSKLYETRPCALESCQNSISRLFNLQDWSVHDSQSTKKTLEEKSPRKNLLDEEPAHLELRAQSTEKNTLHEGKTDDFEVIDTQRKIHERNNQVVEALEKHLNMNPSQVFRGRNKHNMQDDVFNNSRTQLPKYLKPARERKRINGRRGLKLQIKRKSDNNSVTITDSSINEVIRQLDSAATSKVPLDDKHLRKMLRRNKKLMRALVEAFKLRTTINASIETTTPISLNTAEQIEKTKVEDSIATAAISTFEHHSSTSEPITVGETSTRSTTSITESLSISEQLDDITAIDAVLNKSQNDKVVTTQRFYDDFRNHINSAKSSTPIQKKYSNDAINMRVTKNENDTVEDAFDSKDNLNLTQEKPTNEKLDIFRLQTLDEISRNESNLLPDIFTTSGYVPNTRKHASEITSKLYMTQEIEQINAISDDLFRRSSILRLDCLESRRCCKVTRTECSDGSTPRYVKRYYRPRGSKNCLPYYYPKCSQNEEMDEQPIQYEQNCQDICFRGSEKHISPLSLLAIVH